jgi:RNA-binding motif protein, X-linked 2
MSHFYTAKEYKMSFRHFPDSFIAQSVTAGSSFCIVLLVYIECSLMNSVREILSINEQELKRGIAGTPASWHAQYARAAWIYVGNLEYQSSTTALTEGDLICVLSQYGEIEDLHLVRDEETGQSRGFAFCKYEDARSCILAVDNLCGITVRRVYDACSDIARVDCILVL